MKALKNNWLRAGITLMVLVFGVFFIVKAVEKSDTSAKAKVATTYYFTSDQLSDAATESHWSTIPTQNSCVGSEDLPCQITLDEDISTFLENKSPNDVMNDTRLLKRPQP